MNNGIFPGLTQRPGKIRAYSRFTASKWPARAAWLSELGFGASLLTVTVSSNTWTGISFAPDSQVGVMIALGGSTLVTSNGGLSWAAGGALPVGTSWTSVIYSTVSNLFVAINSDNTNAGCATSPDGAVWTSRATLTLGTWIKPSVSDTGVILTAATGSATAGFSSADGGLTWTARTLNSMGNGAVATTWGNGLFAVLGTAGANSTNIQTSPDGITWTNRVTGFSAGAVGTNSFTYGANGFSAVINKSSTSEIALQLISTDGITWVSRDLPVVGPPSGAAARSNYHQYKNGLYYLMTRTGLYVSNDSLNWRGPYNGFGVPLALLAGIDVVSDRVFIATGGNAASTVMAYSNPLAQDILYVP